MDIEKSNEEFERSSNAGNQGLQLKCTFCQLPFSSKTRLAKHMKLHTDVKPFICIYCGESFAHHTDLIKHKEEHHMSKKTFKCSGCTRSFSCRTELKEHSWRHTGKKLHKCDICKKSYSTKGNLKMHIERHSGLKKHKCSVCVQGFTSYSALERHVHKHTGFKLYKCRYCALKFAQSNQLTYHEKVHRGIRQYKCSICNKGFHANSTRLIHEIRHRKQISLLQNKSRKYARQPISILNRDLSYCHNNSILTKDSIFSKDFLTKHNLKVQHENCNDSQLLQFKTDKTVGISEKESNILHQGYEKKKQSYDIFSYDVSLLLNDNNHLHSHPESSNHDFSDLFDTMQRDKARETRDSGGVCKICIKSMSFCDCFECTYQGNDYAGHESKKKCKKKGSGKESCGTLIDVSGDDVSGNIFVVKPRDTMISERSFEHNSDNSFFAGFQQSCSVKIETVAAHETTSHTENCSKQCDCWFCPRKYSSPADVVIHMTNDHYNSVHPLSNSTECNNMSDSKLNIAKSYHVGKWISEIQLSCSKCEKTFLSQAVCSIHEIAHTVLALDCKS